jgi:hypothetical protein
VSKPERSRGRKLARFAVWAAAVVMGAIVLILLSEKYLPVNF